MSLAVNEFAGKTVSYHCVLKHSTCNDSHNLVCSSKRLLERVLQKGALLGSEEN